MGKVSRAAKTNDKEETGEKYIGCVSIYGPETKALPRNHQSKNSPVAAVCPPPFVPAGNQGARSSSAPPLGSASQAYLAATHYFLQAFPIDFVDAVVNDRCVETRSTLEDADGRLDSVSVVVDSVFDLVFVDVLALR